MAPGRRQGGQPSGGGTSAGGANEMRRSVAIIGSSGGGQASLGGGQSLALIEEVKKQLQRAGIEVAAIQFVESPVPLDRANGETPASLWGSQPGMPLARVLEGTLTAVNNQAAVLDRKISQMVLGDDPVRVHGLVACSVDVDGVNKATLEAARKMGIPVVGTGGSSLGQAVFRGLKVIGNSGGSVATTTQSRAFSFAASLAGYWGLPFRPDLTMDVNPVSVLGACVPVFMSVMLLSQTLQALEKAWNVKADIFDWREINAVVVAAVMSSQAAKMGETGTMAGVMAGIMTKGGVIAGLLAGVVAGYMCRLLLVFTARAMVVPATASTIITAGCSGAVGGLLGWYALRPVGDFMGTHLLALLDVLQHPAQGWLQAVMGACWGLVMCYGSQVGWYHSVFLPMILLEMEDGTPSFVGAMDFCTLCLVSGGICLATALLPKAHPGLTPLGRRGAFINLLWGDFVEACYPFMEKSPLVNLSAYLASAISGALISTNHARSSAYLPFFISVLLGPTQAIVYPALVAFGLPFVIAFATNLRTIITKI